MDPLTFASILVTELAWPATTVFILFFVLKNAATLGTFVREFLGRVNKIQFGEATIEIAAGDLKPIQIAPEGNPAQSASEIPCVSRITVPFFYMTPESQFQSIIRIRSGSSQNGAVRVKVRGATGVELGTFEGPKMLPYSSIQLSGSAIATKVKPPALGEQASVELTAPFEIFAEHVLFESRTGTIKFGSAFAQHQPRT